MDCMVVWLSAEKAVRLGETGVGEGFIALFGLDRGDEARGD